MKNIKVIGTVCLAILISMLAIGCGSGATSGGGSGGSSGTQNPVDHISTIDAVGGHSTCLAIDSAGKPRISYYRSSDFKVYYTKWTGTTWEAHAITSGAGGGTGFKLGSQDSYAIAFYDASGLICGTGNDSSSGGGTVDSFTYGFSYYGVSLALDANEHSRVSYYNADQNCLKYAEYDGSNWILSTIDATAGVGKYSSIVLNTYGSPEISYYDATNKWLKYAKWTGSAFDLSTVDATGADVGKYSSITLDNNGRPWISYVYENKVYVASWEGSVWDKRQVSSTIASFMYTTIKIGSDNIPWISYFNGSDKLYLASWEGSTWDNQVIQGGSQVGEFPSLALYNNKPRISYRIGSVLMYYWQ